VTIKYLFFDDKRFKSSLLFQQRNIASAAATVGEIEADDDDLHRIEKLIDELRRFHADERRFDFENVDGLEPEFFRDQDFVRQTR